MVGNRFSFLIVTRLTKRDYAQMAEVDVHEHFATVRDGVC